MIIKRLSMLLICFAVITSLTACTVRNNPAAFLQEIESR